MELKNKTILILSQQDWGEMFISKHHYAVELAKLGNTVYFINGPDQNRRLNWGEIKITKSNFENLYLVEHRLFYPYIIKFKAAALHHSLMKLHIRRIIRKISKRIDIVWSFDLSNTIPLKCFPSAIVKIFMPVDEPLQPIAIKSAESADIILSVTNEILEKYSQYTVPKHFINHGVSEDFICNDIVESKSLPIKIGISGNILRPDIDFETLEQIIQDNKNIEFHFWGTVDHLSSNLVLPQYVDKNATRFIKKIQQFKNVKLHGQLPAKKLAFELRNADGFLICYDIKRDQSKGTNYHKILEYLATGKFVVSNNVTTYQKLPGLLEMTKERDTNSMLPNLFKDVINKIGIHNSKERQLKRIEFAKSYTYKQQIKRIENILRQDIRKD